METIAEAKEFLRSRLDKGAKCPCCSQHVRMYKRKINSGMVLFLIGLYKLAVDDTSGGKSYFHNSEIMKRMGINTSSLDYSVMKHFGLMVDMPNESKETKGSGYWGITTGGIDFILGTTKIPKHVLIYNGKRYGFSDEIISSREALGEKFNFDELMGGK